MAEPVVILGLTGSIGAGKTFAARTFARAGATVFDADAVVHRLLVPGGTAVAAVGAAFPEVVRRGPDGPWADRSALADRVFADSAALARLEAILHPLEAAARARFLRHAAASRRRLAVVDVPLLFETGGERQCDAVILVTAPLFLQTQRVLRRTGMTSERLVGIRRRLLSQAEKSRRATYVVRSGLGSRHTLRAVCRIVRQLRHQRGVKWPPRGAALRRP